MAAINSFALLSGFSNEQVFTMTKFATSPLDSDLVEYDRVIRPDTVATLNTLAWRSSPIGGGDNTGGALRIRDLRIMVSTGTTQGSNFNIKLLKPGWGRIGRTGSSEVYDYFFSIGYKDADDKYRFFDNPIGAVMPYKSEEGSRWTVFLGINYPFQNSAQAPDSLTGYFSYDLVKKNMDFSTFTNLQPPYSSM